MKNIYFAQTMETTVLKVTTILLLVHGCMLKLLTKLALTESIYLINIKVATPINVHVLMGVTYN